MTTWIGAILVGAGGIGSDTRATSLAFIRCAALRIESRRCPADKSTDD